MESPLQPLAQALKAAREHKGLTQQALGRRVGLPQSHISRIEAGAVDLQTSNLIEMARAVDLEVVLVSRSVLPAIQAIQSQAATAQSLPLRAYRLDPEDQPDGD